MNDPLLPRKEQRVLPSFPILLFAAGIPLVLWLLYGRDETMPAAPSSVAAPSAASAAAVTTSIATTSEAAVTFAPQQKSGTPP